MKNFLVLSTGGTIASMEGEEGLKPVMGADDLLKYVSDISEKFNVDTVEFCNIDSTNMRPGLWKKLADCIKRYYKEYNGFLICHGTDTLAYTAAALSYMIQDSQKPVILTGSQKPITYESTDAIMNLRESFLYMLEEETRGVQVVFGGRVIAGTRAKKINSLSYQAFSSINFPDMAAIRNDKVIRYIESCRCIQKDPVFETKINPRVFLLKLTPCTDEQIIKEIYHCYDGIIVEGFGVGGIPDHLLPAFYECSKKYGHSKLLVLTTQVVAEGSHVSVYEVGKRLQGEIPFLEAKDMNLEAVVAKIMWILGQDRGSFEENARIFYSTVNYDILAY